jgi:serine/threonine protein phosphatase PrpC
MEDAHVAIDMPTQTDHVFLAVFDGHGGSGAAIYAGENIVSFIQNTPQWADYCKGGATDIDLLGKAMTQAFENIDSEMRKHQDSTGGHDTSGCTAVTAMITPKYIICANAGDSRCVMGVDGVAKPLSEDHKPSDELERKRILDAGGTVQWKRVDGDLAVSRAFGDFQYKTRFDLPAKDQKVTYYPDITVHERTAKDDILLLACDGLWDVMTNPEAIDLVRKIYESGEEDVVKIAEEMIDMSLDKGSRDNISAVVVKLPGAVIGPKEGGGVDKMREAREARINESRGGSRGDVATEL